MDEEVRGKTRNQVNTEEDRTGQKLDVKVSDGHEIQCQCGQYHTDEEKKVGIIRYSAQRDGRTIEVGTLYFFPDCELMPGLNIDWSGDPFPPVPEESTAGEW